MRNHEPCAKALGNNNLEGLDEVVRCVCLCVSRSVCTVCTAVTQAINFVTNPRADAPAQYTVERAMLHIIHIG